MSSLTSFNFNGADVRTIVLPNGEPGFVGKDVAERLGYADTVNAIKQHCRGVAFHHPIPDASLVRRQWHHARRRAGQAIRQGQGVAGCCVPDLRARLQA